MSDAWRTGATAPTQRATVQRPCTTGAAERPAPPHAALGAAHAAARSGSHRGGRCHMWRNQAASSTMGSVPARAAPTPSERFEQTVARIEELFHEHADAEELASSEALLCGIKRALDSKRRVAAPGTDRVRGLPLWIVVRVRERTYPQTKALKCSWHADGSWPLIGYDEAERHRICNPDYCIVHAMHVSQHKHVDVVRNATYEDGKRGGLFLPCRPTPQEFFQVEPDADTIAQAYAARAA